MSRRTLPARRLAAAAVLPLALTTLAACGSDDGSTAQKASSSTGSSEEAEPEESQDAAPVDDEGGEVAEGEQVDAEEFMKTFEAAFDKATTVHMSMEMDMGATGSMVAEGDADYTTDPTNMVMTMSGAAFQGQEMDLRLVDGVMYMKMPAMGEKFFQLDLNDPSNPLGAGFTDMLDVRAMFEGFGDSLDSVVYEGEEEIDGETTDEYTVSVDSSTLLESQGQQLPPGAGVPDMISYSIYFSEDGLYRRLEMDMGDTLGAMTMDFTDWGSDVTIEAPPAGEVTEFPAGAMPGGATAG